MSKMGMRVQRLSKLHAEANLGWAGDIKHVCLQVATQREAEWLDAQEWVEGDGKVCCTSQHG